MAKKIGDVKTLNRIAAQWKPFPILESKRASEFLSYLADETDGWVIVDFLDATNWDRLDRVFFDSTSNIQWLIWHDFIDEDKMPPSPIREMTSMVFPASLYGAIISIDEIDLLGNEDISFFAIRGYALKDSEIRKVLAPKAEDFILREHRPFSKEVLRKVDGHIEVIDCFNSATYSILLVPKGPHFSSFGSKYLLYHRNLKASYSSLESCKADLDTLAATKRDAICEKANTVRRNMEAMLKLESCYRNIRLSKSYSQAKLGDLWGALKSVHSESIKQLMGQFIEWANELSHHSGIPIRKDKALFINMVASLYAELFMQEIYHERRYPRLRDQDEECISF